MRLKLMLIATLLFTCSETSSAQPVIQAVPEQPRIVVDGFGQVKTPPDVAIIDYTARGEGATSDAAVEAMTATEARIRAAVQILDPAAQLRTDEVKVSPVKSADCKETWERVPQMSVAACAVVGYVATQSIIVTTGSVKDSGTIVGLVGRNGGFEARISSFDLRDPHTAQQQAMTAALADASSKASTIALASHVPLGRLLSVSTSNQSDNSAIVVTGTIRRSDRMNAPPPVVVDVAPEPIVTKSNVTVTYAIGQ
jgi:uncharacterized protein YggE